MSGAESRVSSRSPVYAAGRRALLGLAFFFAAAAMTVNASAQPTIDAVQASSSTVPAYGKLELTVALHAQFANPYDPSDVRLFGDFEGPNGVRVEVEGFRYQPFRTNAAGQTTPNGAPSWLIRFAPDVAGSWSFRVTCVDRTGTAVSDTNSFECTSSGSHGFVRTASAHDLLFDDGRRFVPIGENMGWWSAAPIGDYHTWIDRLAAHGGNYIRVWMASWAFSPEWTDTGLGNYEARQVRAYYLDDLLEYAESKGVYVQLCLINHGQYSTRINPDWAGNPYSSANGGPCRNPYEFFTNAAARALIKQRFDYIVARWSYSRSLLSWELFNEVDLTDEYANRRSDNADWHHEMAAY